MGGGRGQGGGMGMTGSQGGSILSKNIEMDNLKQQASRLNQKMKEVISRINRLENSEKR
jgi:vacuolar-type H+-ATPase subunit D/Vma8